MVERGCIKFSVAGAGHIGERRPRLTQEEKHEIAQRMAAINNANIVAEECGVDPQTVRRIVRDFKRLHPRTKFDTPL